MLPFSVPYLHSRIDDLGFSFRCEGCRSQPVDTTRAKVLGSPACYRLVFEYLGPYSLRFETKPLELEPGATRI